jgi:hypothetical protein
MDLVAPDRVVISDLATLRQWKSLVRGKMLPSLLPGIEFDLASIDPGQNRRLTREAERFRGACGCSASGLAMAAAIGVTAWSLANGSRTLAAVPPIEWAGYLLLLVVASAAGKVAGLWWARTRMLRLVGEVERHIGEPRAGQRAHAG